MKVTTTTPAHTAELTHLEVRQAIREWLKDNLNHTKDPAPPGAWDAIHNIQIAEHGNGGIRYTDLNDNDVTLEVSW